MLPDLGSLSLDSRSEDPRANKEGWECGDLPSAVWRVDICTLEVGPGCLFLETGGAYLEASRYASSRMLHPNTRIVGGVRMHGSMDHAF